MMVADLPIKFVSAVIFNVIIYFLGSLVCKVPSLSYSYFSEAQEHV